MSNYFTSLLENSYVLKYIDTYSCGPANMTADVKRGASILVLPVEPASEAAVLAIRAQGPLPVRTGVKLAAVVIENVVLVPCFALK